MLALVLGVLTLTGAVELWMVWILALGLGVARSFDTPTRQAFVSELVSGEALARAIGINSTVVSAARMVGPAAGGAIIALLGVGVCFVVNAASFLGPLCALAAMDTARLNRPERPAVRPEHAVRAGLGYVRDRRDLLVPLLMMAIVGTLAFEFQVTIPLMAHSAFHLGATGFGLLYAAMGVGAVVSGLTLAGRIAGRVRTLTIAAAAFAVTLGAAAAAPGPATAAVCLAFAGAASVVYSSTTNATLQIRAEPAMRGRVVALYVIAFMGSTAIGGPLRRRDRRGRRAARLAGGRRGRLCRGRAPGPGLRLPPARSAAGAPPAGVVARRLTRSSRAARSGLCSDRCAPRPTSRPPTSACATAWPTPCSCPRDRRPAASWCSTAPARRRRTTTTSRASAARPGWRRSASTSAATARARARSTAAPSRTSRRWPRCCPTASRWRCAGRAWAAGWRSPRGAALGAAAVVAICPASSEQLARGLRDRRFAFRCRRGDARRAARGDRPGRRRGGPRRPAAAHARRGRRGRAGRAIASAPRRRARQPHRGRARRRPPLRPARRRDAGALGPLHRDPLRAVTGGALYDRLGVTYTATRARGPAPRRGDPRRARRRGDGRERRRRHGLVRAGATAASSRSSPRA